MAIRYSLVESNTTDIPTNAAQTFNRGFNLPGGPIDEFIIRMTITAGADPIAADMSNIMNSVRLILNGSTVHDFRSGYAAAANNAPGLYGYFLNSLGAGRFVEVPGTTTKEAYFRIPVGRNIAPGVSRLEYTISYAALTAASTGGTFQMWVRYNTAMQTTTTVAAATSFTHAASEEQVVVRLPQGVPGTVAGLMIQNDSAADQLNGIRVLSQSDFSLDVDQWRAFNGDLYNGVVFADAGASATAQQYAIQVAGGLFLPLYGLSMNDDIRLQVNSSAATTRTYTPVITAPINGAQESRGVQTQAVASNVATAVLDQSGQADA